jgi:predicted dehydrogenase
MLTEETLDGIISVTPTPMTCQLTCQILQAGIPVLMEKPLGISLSEGEEVVRIARITGTPVMVGMNRQHDPVVRWALDKLVENTPRYARAVIRRKNRKEEKFIEDAGLHAVDLLMKALGRGRLRDVAAIQPDCGEAVTAHLQFSTATAVLELLPSCGQWLEEYTFSGDGFLMHIIPQKSATFMKAGSEPDGFERPAGVEGAWTTGETIAFLKSLRGEASWSPTPESVLHSMRLTSEISVKIKSLTAG